MLMMQFRRNGQAIQMPNGWGSWHQAVMWYVADMEETPGLKEKIGEIAGINLETDAIPMSPQLDRDIIDEVGHHKDTGLDKNGSMTIKNGYKFIDPDDGEILELMPGDELYMWYSR